MYIYIYIYISLSVAVFTRRAEMHLNARTLDLRHPDRKREDLLIQFRMTKIPIELCTQCCWLRDSAPGFAARPTPQFFIWQNTAVVRVPRGLPSETPRAAPTTLVYHQGSGLSKDNRTLMLCRHFISPLCIELPAFSWKWWQIAISIEKCPDSERVWK